jgi:glycerate-2-kinase
VGFIRNREELLAHGEVRLRALALDLAEAALAASDPGQAVRRLVALDGDTLIVRERAYPLAGRRIFVIGAGKASFPIAQALDDILGPRIHTGLVTCKYEQEGVLSHIRLHFAAHPVPDEASLAAARRTVELLSEVRPSDLVLACFTGGSSALFALPADGLTLVDKAATTKILLTCGADIIEINAVRKHLSRVKGGRLARLLPANVELVNLTVSDVVGDGLDCVTDPTVPDTSSLGAARAVLDKYDLWRRVPTAVSRHLRLGTDETLRASDFAHLSRQDVLLAGSDVACRAALAAARQKGHAALLLSTVFEGESRELGRAFAAITRQVFASGEPVAMPCVLIGGGETTVRFDGEHGLGGPNQEFAAALALALDGRHGVAALGLDTDGTDGPTTVAGALIDGTSAARARRARIDLSAHLARHDVTPALVGVGDAVLTGATGTNVNDLKLVVLAPQI